MHIYQANPEKIIYIGKWENSETVKIARSDCSKAFVMFKGSRIKVIANGNIRCSLDGAKEAAEKEFITTDGVHTLFITASRGAVIQSVEAEELLNADVYLRGKLRAELEDIKHDRPTRDSSGYQSLEYKAVMPSSGVKLNGFFGAQFQKGVDRVKLCAKYPHYLAEYDRSGDKTPTGWTTWLPAATDGRILAGAAKSYLWTGEQELRDIVDRVVDKIAQQSREDGYWNYYPEEKGFGNIYVPNGDNDVQTLMDSELKNFDRIFWTYGMIAAGAAGNEKAFELVRAMYTWLDDSKYKYTLHWGHNATNAYTGNLILGQSKVGSMKDVLFHQKYVDLQVMEEAFLMRNPLAFSHYPADRPHCYVLLTVLAAAQEYQLTGDSYYLDVARGGWEIYNNYYKHAGGITAICESDGPYLPGSYYVTTGHTGETCASVFWVWLNAELAQLFPENAEYAAQIEEVLFNVLPTVISPEGNIRYHNTLQGEKDAGKSIGTCCEITGTHLYADLPKYMFSYNKDTVYVNQFISAELDTGDMHLCTDADIFAESKFTVTFAKAPAEEKHLKVRIPHWTKNVEISVNGAAAETANAGGFADIVRKWTAGDTVTVTFTPERKLVQYTGAEQMRDGVPTPPGDPRYALFCGPYLMALTGDYKVEVPTLRVNSRELEAVVENKDLVTVPVDDKLKFVPYHLIDKEKFCVYVAYKVNQQLDNQPSDT